MHMWAVPKDSPLLHGDLENAKLLFYEYLSACYYVNTYSKLLPNKYMRIK